MDVLCLGHSSLHVAGCDCNYDGSVHCDGGGVGTVDLCDHGEDGVLFDEHVVEHGARENCKLRT